MFGSIIQSKQARRPMRLAQIIGTIAAVAAIAVVAVPIENAAANSAGAGIDKGVTVSCGYRQLTVTVSAAGWYNGQTVATRILVRRFGETTWYDATGWKFNVINPITYVAIGTGSTAKTRSRHARCTPCLCTRTETT